MLAGMRTRISASLRQSLPWLGSLLVLGLTACTYDSPLASPQALPVDAGLIGIWKAIDENAAESPATMVVLPFTPTEYLIHYPTANDDSMYFRGYAIEVAGIRCVQLELLGSHEGRETSSTRFTVARYRLNGDSLEIQTLNASKVSSELEGSDALRAAFEQAAADPELFNNPATFKRASG